MLTSHDPLNTLSRHLSPALQAVVDRFVKRQTENGHRIIVADGGGQEFLLGEEESDDAEEVEVPKALGDIFESVAGAVYLGRGIIQHAFQIFIYGS